MREVNGDDIDSQLCAVFFATGMNQNRIMQMLRQAKKLAQEYRTLMGKPLGITGEVPSTKHRGTLGSNSHRRWI